jgi:hypothetical protein
VLVLLVQLAVVGVALTLSSARAAVSFIQVAAATPQSPTATVSVTYSAAQTAGDLNIVVVGWNDTSATVQQVRDSTGNVYSLAIGPTSGTALRQSIYYAANIVGGTNTVTVTFSQAAAYPDIRILQYRGVNTLDVTAGASGSSATASSGAATTTVANELIFGANTVFNSTTAAGTGFTSRTITSPDGDIAEDQTATSAGSKSATAPLNASGPWVMQMATFYAATATGSAPTVTSISPNTGPTAGGTAVTIAGTNFASGATVTIGGAAATNVVVTNSTTITATTPPGAAGAAAVTVTVAGQSGSLAGGFTYRASPTVTSVSPANGPPAGGTAVTITGTNFLSGATVTFGAAAATNVSVTSGTTITATTPSGSPGAVAITVTNSNGQSGSLAGGFTYLSPPTVTSVTPNTGPVAGGTALTITGSNFASGATVTIGGAAATNVVVTSSTTITATTPSGTAGAATVTVAVAGQSASLTGGFTYQTTPTVTSVSPAAGPLTGGTAVTITGTNFLSGATVTFGTTAATNVAVTSGTTITATTPSGSAGAVTVTVTNSNGQSASLASGFTYVPPPTVTSVSPSSGSTAGGTAVTVSGTNFASGATVTIGGAPATNVVVTNATTITATTPAGSAGPVAITVTTPGPQSGTLQNGFTYVASTAITYVQSASATPQSAQTSVKVTFAAAQAAGDLNVVVAGWNDSTATVSSVTDTTGNVYTRAVGPTVVSGLISQSIYYARNIGSAAAGANAVTVTFSTAAAYPDIRILEYAGADRNVPVDVVAAGSGNSATSSSGNATTSSAVDLLFAANIVLTTTSGPGTGFTQRILTSPDGDIAEDRMVTTVGTYSATAPLSSGAWIMQMVAFRTPSGPVPGVSLNPTSANFGNQATGTTSNPQPVTLTNVGTAQLAISSIVISGGNAGDFAQTNNCGTGLAPNNSCTINVTFTPSTTGTRTSSVVITDTAGGSPHTVALSGTGAGGLTVTPRVTALTFTRTQQFTAASGVTWSVDGIAGGSPSSGTITTNGLYTPPGAAGTHTVTATTSTLSASATVYVTNYPGTFTHHNDNLRTGLNSSETVLTLSNVNQNQFGKLFSYPLDGIALASPLYVANVNIPGQGFHNVVYVATENDSVYAFDADGITTAPLWHVSFLGSGVTAIPCTDATDCPNIPPQIGITGTPVIDQNSATLYVVAATKERGNTYVQRLHALDITTGAEKFGGPVPLQASVPGTGTGASGGSVAFDALHENQRAALLLSNGVVYMAWASHNDTMPWHGWILGYNATTLQQTMVYNATPNGNGGGIWQSGGGLSTDATGNIYFATGNGDFDANTGGVDYGDSVVKMSPAGAILDYFTPHDQLTLSGQDFDLGSGGPVLLVDQTSGPNPHLLITSGKAGTIYVLNRDNLGTYNGNNDNQIVQSLPGVLPHGTAEIGNFSTSVFFNGYVYFGAANDSIRAFQLTNGLLSTVPTSQTSATYGVRGSSFAISANGNSNGILWALQNNGAGPENDTMGNPGVLFAYNANDLTTELYDSSQAGTRDTMDLASKFSIPLVVNGKVFVAGQAQLTAFGLLP